MLSTVTAKGQVTIPTAIRDALGISSNDRIAFVREGERVFIQPIKTLKSFRGAVKAKEMESFENERALAKAAVARRVEGESR